MFVSVNFVLFNWFLSFGLVYFVFTINYQLFLVKKTGQFISWSLRNSFIIQFHFVLFVQLLFINNNAETDPCLVKNQCRCFLTVGQIFKLYWLIEKNKRYTKYFAKFSVNGYFSGGLNFIKINVCCLNWKDYLSS